MQGSSAIHTFSNVHLFHYLKSIKSTSKVCIILLNLNKCTHLENQSPCYCSVNLVHKTSFECEVWYVKGHYICKLEVCPLHSNKKYQNICRDTVVGIVFHLTHVKVTLFVKLIKYPIIWYGYIDVICLQKLKLST